MRFKIDRERDWIRHLDLTTGIADLDESNAVTDLGYTCEDFFDSKLNIYRWNISKVI